MCDCYWAKCEECDELVPIHIRDYNFPRTMVKAWCGKHIPILRDFPWSIQPGVEVFAVTDFGKKREDDEKSGTFFALMLCDGIKRPSEDGVEPNISECRPLLEFTPKGKK